MLSVICGYRIFGSGGESTLALTSRSRLIAFPIIPLDYKCSYLGWNSSRDRAIKFWHYRELRGLVQLCACGQKFDITLALNCKKGVFTCGTTGLRSSYQDC